MRLPLTFQLQVLKAGNPAQSREDCEDIRQPNRGRHVQPPKPHLIEALRLRSSDVEVCAGCSHVAPRNQIPKNPNPRYRLIVLHRQNMSRRSYYCHSDPRKSKTANPPKLRSRLFRDFQQLRLTCFPYNLPRSRAGAHEAEATVTQKRKLWRGPLNVYKMKCLHSFVPVLLPGHLPSQRRTLSLPTRTSNHLRSGSCSLWDQLRGHSGFTQTQLPTSV